ncbi:MAPEG family protein [Microbulbifer sp.]|uniref:MAPEG family protein n=1 Tax=Microbulbifer sp. TaxID=1908541 RepID=UPI00258265C4|nr:MAPEG family protein [Microbulbifer sp.]
MSQESNNKTVKRGMAVGLLGALFLFSALYYMFPKITQEVVLIERVRLGIECLVFPSILFLATILRVGSQRYGNPSEDPTKVIANSKGMAVDLRVLSNTHEQIVVFAINTLALSVLLPYQYLSLLPIYSGMFVVGRMIFWLAYHNNVLWRAPGFALSTLPALAGLGYCGLVLMLRIFS